MAVPSAPVGSLADASTDSATPPPDSSPRFRSALLVAFVAVIVGCLLALAVLAFNLFDVRDDGSGSGGGAAELQSQREELMAQTAQFALRVNTYGPESLDDQNKMPTYVEEVSELMTAKFAASFEQSVVLAEAQVAQAGYARSAKVYVTGVASLDDDAATVLVGFMRVDSYPKPGDPDTRVNQPGNPERWAVQLVHTDGEWVVDNYAVISELPEAAAEPSGAASPSAPPTSGGGQP